MCAVCELLALNRVKHVLNLCVTGLPAYRSVSRHRISRESSQFMVERNQRAKEPVN